MCMELLRSDQSMQYQQEQRQQRQLEQCCILGMRTGNIVLNLSWVAPEHSSMNHELGTGRDVSPSQTLEDRGLRPPEKNRACL